MKHTAAEYEQWALNSIKIHNECDTPAEGESDWRNAILFATLAQAAATLEAAHNTETVHANTPDAGQS